MQRLRDALRKAQDERAAIGHFNIADLVLLKAVFAAARAERSSLSRCVQWRTRVYRYSSANANRSGAEFA